MRLRTHLGAVLAITGSLIMSASLFLNAFMGRNVYLDAMLWWATWNDNYPYSYLLMIGYYLFFTGLLAAGLKRYRLSLEGGYSCLFSGSYGLLAPLFVYILSSKNSSWIPSSFSFCGLCAASIAFFSVFGASSALGGAAGFFMFIYSLYYFLVGTLTRMGISPIVAQGALLGFVGISGAFHLAREARSVIQVARPTPVVASSPPQIQQSPRQPSGASTGSCSGYSLSQLADDAKWENVVKQCIIRRELYGYIVEDVLGKGGFGIVLRAHTKGEPSDKAAIKLLIPVPPGASGKATITRNVAEIVEELEKEASSLKQLSQESPYIVRLYAIHADSNLLKKAMGRDSLEMYLQSPPAIVMEYMAGGSLREWINNFWSSNATTRSGGLTEEALRAVLALGAIVAKALDAVHKARYIHSDVKPENILFTESPPLEPGAFRHEISRALRDPDSAKVVPKLSDLGAAVGIGKKISQITPAYAAPDIIGHDSLCKAGQHQSLYPICSKPLLALPGHDVFSLLAILFELTTGLRGGISRFYATWCRPDPVKKAVCDKQRIRADLEQIYGQLYPSLPAMKEFFAPLLARLLALPSEKMPSAGKLAECLSCLADRPVNAWKNECRLLCSF